MVKQTESKPSASNAAPGRGTVPKPASQSDHWAKFIALGLVPSAIHSIIDVTEIDVDAAAIAYKTFLANAGSPQDPVEKCLLDQFMLANHRLTLLQSKTAKQDNLEAIKIFNAAAVRLLAEIRRLALAIRQYRMPASSRSFSVIHQQNVASVGGKQDVQYVADAEEHKSSLQCRDKPVADTQQEESLHELRERVAREESAAGGSRTKERSVAATVDA